MSLPDEDVAPQERHCDEGVMIDARPSLQSWIPGRRNKDGSEKHNHNAKENGITALERYRISDDRAGNVGLAVIINNEHFHWSTGMNQRRGTDADERNLKYLFQKLRFQVMVHKDVTSSHILKVAKDLASIDHLPHDCFTMAFLSHGDDGEIYGTDGTVDIRDIVNLFRGDVCPSLAGKPKIFFFQACRGSKHEIGVEPCVDCVDGADLNEVVVDSAVRPTIPSGSDFLFCYSVAEGFYSHRDTLHGSWYVQALVKVFDEEISNKGDDIDMLDLLTLVNQRVSRKSVERSRDPNSIGRKQMPCFLSMLTKKLCLSCKN